MTNTIGDPNIGSIFSSYGCSFIAKIMLCSNSPLFKNECNVKYNDSFLEMENVKLSFLDTIYYDEKGNRMCWGCVMKDKHYNDICMRQFLDEKNGYIYHIICNFKLGARTHRI